VRILLIIFLAGAFVLVFSVTGPYPLLGAGATLLAVGVSFFVGASILAMWPKDVRTPASHVLIALFPWLLAAFTLANGAWDHSHETLYQTVVVKQDFGRSWDVLTVRSWRPNHTTESLYIKTGFDFRTRKFVGAFFFEDKPVAVGIRTGAFGVPWISRISQGHNDFYYPAPQ
jgi:hypothetical protein